MGLAWIYDNLSQKILHNAYESGDIFMYENMDEQIDREETNDAPWLSYRFLYELGVFLVSLSTVFPGLSLSWSNIVNWKDERVQRDARLSLICYTEFLDFPDTSSRVIRKIITLFS